MVLRIFPVLLSCLIKNNTDLNFSAKSRIHAALLFLKVTVFNSLINEVNI